MRIKQLPDGACRTNGYQPLAFWKGESEFRIGLVPAPKEHAQNLLWKTIQKDLTIAPFIEFYENRNVQKWAGVKALEILYEEGAPLEVRMFQDPSNGSNKKVKKLFFRIEFSSERFNYKKKRKNS